MSAVNDQITDAVSQVNALLTGSSASQSIGMLDVASAETLGMSMFNAVTAQQNAQTSSSAAATASCAKILQVQMATPAPAPASNAVASLKLQIQLAEQKMAVTVAAAVMVELYLKANPTATPADAVKAFEAEITDAVAKLSLSTLEESVLDSAGKLLTADIQSTITLLQAIDAATPTPPPTVQPATT